MVGSHGNSNSKSRQCAAPAALPMLLLVAVTALVSAPESAAATPDLSPPPLHDAHTAYNGSPPHAMQPAFAQGDGLDMELEVSDDEKIVIFAGFAAAVIGVFLFLARDIILRRKTDYDSEEYASKNDRTYEKYHSEWTDDYEEIGTRKRTRAAKDLFDGTHNGERLPDYYAILGVAHDATKSEIKKAFRRLAKEAHPDRAVLGTKDKARRTDAGGDDGRTANNPDKTMAEINKAYEILSDDDLKKRYDVYLQGKSGI